MIQKILVTCALTLFSLSGFAEQKNKDVVILSHESWTTQGNDATVHVIDGHLIEKKRRNKWIFCLHGGLCV